jgi:hypothetical protein
MGIGVLHWLGVWLYYLSHSGHRDRKTTALFLEFRQGFYGMCDKQRIYYYGPRADLIKVGS